MCQWHIIPLNEYARMAYSGVLGEAWTADLEHFEHPHDCMDAAIWRPGGRAMQEQMLRTASKGRQANAPA